MNLVKLSLFWLPVSMTWSALLSIAVPRQVDLFAPASLRGTVLGLVLALGGFLGAAVQLAVGYRSDQRRQRRPFVLKGTLVAAVALAAMGLASGPWALLAGFVLLELGLNWAQGPYQALLPDLVPPSRHGLASTWMGLFQHVGQAAGPALAGWLLVRPAGLSRLCWILAGLLLACMAATLTGLREGSGPAPEGRLQPDPNFVRLLISRLLINMGLYTALSFMLFYVRYSLGSPHPEPDTGQLMACMVLAGIAGGLPAGPLADRYSKLRLIYVTNLVVGSAALAFIASSTMEGARLAGLVLGLGFGAFTVIDWALMCTFIPGAGTARFLGWWNLTSTLPQMLAPAMAGPFTDLLSARIGAAAAYRYSLLLVVAYLLAGTLMLRRVRERSH